MSNISPKQYGKTRELEILAITKFENLIDSSRIATFISKDNTIPDTDGYIVIIDERTIPTCKFEVQIKKLNDNDEENPKIKCPVSIFGYAQSFFYPFLFIVVDIHNNKAYWIHIGDTLRNQYQEKLARNQDSVTIHFPKENCIDGKNTKYIEIWENIFQNQATKLKRYDDLKRELTELKENSSISLTISSSDICEIHSFLDSLNYLTDKKFPIIKRIFFPEAWKIGLGYFGYTDKKLEFALYPIPYDKNDIQIKEIHEHLKEKFLKERGFEGWYLENPIKTRSDQFSIEILEKLILKILKNRLLNQRNEYLAREFIFAFIDKFHVQLCLETKHIYTIEEIENAFFRYLPHDHIPRILRGNEKFSFGIFFELLAFVKSLRVDEIQRVYSLKDYERLRRKGVRWVWDVYSPEQVKENLSIFFANLNDVYTSVVDRNFPEIKNDLAIFGDANRIVAVYNVREEYDMDNFPSINFYFLVDESLDKIVFELYNHNEVPDLSSIHQIRSDRIFSIKGREYKIIAMSQSVLDFIFNDMPMMDYCYKLLEDNLKLYFQKLKQV